AARGAGWRRHCRPGERCRMSRSPGWRRRKVLRPQSRRSPPYTRRRRSVRAGPRSFAPELGGALFEERGDAFLKVFRRARDALRFEFEVELFLEGIFRTVPIEFSDQRQRDRRAIGEIMRE